MLRRRATTALARLLLYARAFSERHRGVAEREVHCGLEWAARLGLSAIPEASDALARFWGDARTLVIEHDPDGAPTTLAVGHAAKKLAK